MCGCDKITGRLCAAHDPRKIAMLRLWTRHGIAGSWGSGFSGTGNDEKSMRRRASGQETPSHRLNRYNAERANRERAILGKIGPEPKPARIMVLSAYIERIREEKFDPEKERIKEEKRIMGEKD